MTDRGEAMRAFEKLALDPEVPDAEVKAALAELDKRNDPDLSQGARRMMQARKPRHSPGRRP